MFLPFWDPIAKLQKDKEIPKKAKKQNLHFLKIEQIGRLSSNYNPIVIMGKSQPIAWYNTNNDIPWRHE
jgi:hypothetical protein